jgi:hypothetical protein
MRILLERARVVRGEREESGESDGDDAGILFANARRRK